MTSGKSSLACRLTRGAAYGGVNDVSNHSTPHQKGQKLLSGGVKLHATRPISRLEPRRLVPICPERAPEDYLSEPGRRGHVMLRALANALA